VPGIAVRGSDDVVVEANRLDAANWYGVAVDGSRRTRVTENVVTRPGALRRDGGPTVSGIHLTDALAAHVAGNRTEHCGGYGIAVELTHSKVDRPLVVEGNLVKHCGDPAITVQSASNVVVRDNRVLAGTWGFTVGEDGRGCRSVRVEANEFRECAWGGGYVRRSVDCRVTGNTFVDCGQDSLGPGAGRRIGTVTPPRT
jgi:nitrous oxidase accessory protein NosD